MNEFDLDRLRSQCDRLLVPLTGARCSRTRRRRVVAARHTTL